MFLRTVRTENAAFIGTKSAIKFCVKLGKTGAEAYEMIKMTYSEGEFNVIRCIPVTQVLFREPRKAALSSNDDSLRRVKELLNGGRRMDVC